MQRPYVGPSLVTFFFFLVLLSFPHIAAQTNQKKKEKKHAFNSSDVSSLASQ